MKKLFILLMSALLISALFGCADDKSIGIIGGADGPTAIIVSDIK